MASPISLAGFLNPETVVGEFGITPGMRIADLGCGSGHVALLLAQRTGPDGKVTAVDILEDKLDSVRTQAKAAGINNIETIRANLEVLGSSGLVDGSQDMAVLVNILFQSPQKEAIIKEAIRVVRSGGTLIVVEWRPGAGGFGPTDQLRISEDTLKNMVAAAGAGPARSFSAGQFHYGVIFTKA
ncbi:MAG TPA: class I SAM-dependent methyltransferase [Candidatus Paceibacterota bacterium]|nr:class I SAM-dependent methyltransferase [Candidatus Paceibacterota bacterium]